MTSIKIGVDVTPAMLANATVGVMESGYSPWLENLEFTNGSAKNDTGQDSVWYSLENFWDKEKNPHLGIIARYDEADQDEGSFTGEDNITWEDIEKGLQLMAKEAPAHFHDLITENDDAFTHDTLWQFIILGEHVYG